jgi:ribose transport system substrate-binding protein
VRIGIGKAGCASALAIVVFGCAGCGSSGSSTTPSGSSANASNDASTSASGGSTTTATSSAGSSGSHTIELINGNNVDPYFITAWDGAAAEAKAKGDQIVEQAPSTTDPTQQVSLMDDAIANHPSAIILSALEYPPMVAPLEQARAAHIPVVVINNSESDFHNSPNAVAFITSGNSALGFAAGQEMAKLVGNKPVTVGDINEQVGITADIERSTGFEQAMKQYAPKVTVLPMQYAQGNTATADSLASDLITGHSNLAGIYAVDAFTGQGVGTAVKAAGKTGQIKVVSVDAEPQQVTLLKQGIIQALIAQKPSVLGKLAVDDALDAISGQTSKIVRNVDPGHIVITSSSINTPAGQSAIYSSSKP